MSKLRLPGLLCAVAGLVGCDAHPPPRTNVILITLDTTRADFCSLYGHEDRTTPTLEALAESSVVFDAAIAPSTWTLPSHASLWTGLYPRVHGSISSLCSNGDEYGRPLRKDLPTLPGLLHAAGYQTAGFIGGPFLHRGLGFAEGFEQYDDRLDPLGLPADEVNRRALRWLDDARDAGRPLFLFVNYYDPHRAYDPPRSLQYPFGEGEPDCVGPLPKDFDAATSGQLHSPLEVRCARLLYSKEIYAMDHALEALLAELDRRGELHDAFIAIVGDHGEAFGEHEMWTHGGPGYLHQRRVPMLLARRGGATTHAERIREPVSIVRLPRTLLESVGVAVPDAWLDPGLLPFRSAKLPPLTERFVLAESFFTISLPGWTYLRVEPRKSGSGTQELLFDLTADPGEVADVVGRVDRPDVRAVLNEARTDWDAMTQAWGGPEPRLTPIYAPDEATRERLRALGYVR